MQMAQQWYDDIVAKELEEVMLRAVIKNAKAGVRSHRPNR